MVSRENEGVSLDKDFEVVSGRVEYFHRKISESFDFWIRTFSAIVGGSILLGIDPHFPHERVGNYVILSNSIVGLMGLVTMALIAENLRAWRGYRWAQTQLKSSVPPPRHLSQCGAEWAMFGCVGVSTALFCYFNLFQL
jgi:hypothetical protein